MKHNQGFSLVEAILVVAVLAILASLSTPAITSFLQRQSEQLEANTMEQIAQALEDFAALNGRLPDDNATNNTFCGNPPNTWAHCLTSVTNLSVNQLTIDPWEHERQYVWWEDTAASFFGGSTVSIHYATVHSRGGDQTAEAAPNIAVEVDAPFIGYAPATAGGWWANNGNRTTNFRALEAAGDDFLIKYTNAEVVQAQYNLTLERLSRISDALSTYAASRFNEAIIAEEPDANKKTYFPPADGGNDAITNYGNVVRSEVLALGNGATISNLTDINSTTRRTEMIALMRLLGLPDSFCCNALERISSNQELEAAFYYYSNPRPRTGIATCGTRPNVNQSAPRYLPARITVEQYICR